MITPDQLKSLRESQSLTQNEAGTLVHKTGRSWQRYEAGERPIPSEVVELFCIKSNLAYPPVFLHEKHSA